MFISLAPPGYVAGSAAPLAGARRRLGRAERRSPATATARCSRSATSCVPPHGVGIATAYDDAFDQTPARLLRTAQALGYRGALVHYVGMSHFFRLGRGDGRWRRREARCAAPAEAWHAIVLRPSARRTDFAPIASLCYELLAQHCPDGVAAARRRRHAGADRLGPALGAALARERGRDGLAARGGGEVRRR